MQKSDYANSGGSLPPAEKKWMVTTLAGNGIAALANGPVLSASFNTPTDIAIAPDGTLYVTDGENNRIRKIKE